MIRRTDHAHAAELEYVNVSHGCVEIGVSHQLLARADALAALQQTCGERMTYAEAGDCLGIPEARTAHRTAY